MAAERRPVYSGERRTRIQGLYERDTKTGTVFEFSGRIDGRMVRRILKARNKTDAAAEVLAIRVDATRGEKHRSPTLAIDIAELADLYVGHLRSRIDDRDPRRRRSARTVEDTRWKLAHYVVPVLGTVPVPELSRRDLLRLLDELASRDKLDSKGKPIGKLSPSTRSGVLGIVSSMLAYAVKHEIVERNVARDLDRDDRPGSGRVSEPRYLDADELRALLDRLSDTFRPVCAVYAYAGLRLSEALGLRWQDVDLAEGTLDVRWQLGSDGLLHPLKTGASAALVRMVPALSRELTAHRNRQAAHGFALVRKDALVFVTSTGRHHTARNVLRAVHDAGDKAGLNGPGREKVGVHDLRHSFVAAALEHGLTLPEASALARHRNVAVTASVYAGLTDKARDQAADKLASAGFGQ